MATLDNILSGEGNDSPEPGTPTAQEAQQAEGQQAQPQATDEPHDEVIDAPDGRQLVPLKALQETRGKVKRYTEQVAEFEKTASGQREQIGNLTRQVTELLQRIPQQERPQQQVPDFYENPVEATRHQIHASVNPHFEQINQTLQAIAKDTAIGRFDEATVDAAEQAFLQAMQSRALDPADFQKVVNSPNRYAAAVQWHKRVQAQSEIGDDPAAYRAKIEAEILAKHGLTTDGTQQQGRQPGPQGAAPVMPSNLAGARNVGNRTGPAWSGPKTLNDIFQR